MLALINNPANCNKQGGAALVVSLILLAVVTLLGISSMKSSNSELKMAASMRDRGVAFEAAEAVLAVVEDRLALDPPIRENLLSNCAGAECFNANCDNGLCFAGEYYLSSSEYECQTVYTGSSSGGGKKGSSKGLDVEPVEFWSDKTLDVWNNNARHKTVKVDSINQEVKYIVEFLCYVPRDEFTPFSEAAHENNNGAPLYRITALAEGNGGRATVALQSTYKVLNGH